MFQSLTSFLSGKKTYLVSLGVLLYAAGIHFGWWAHQPDIDLMFGGAGAMTFRAAIKKLCLQIAGDPALADDVSRPLGSTATTGHLLLLAALLPAVLMFSGCKTLQGLSNQSGLTSAIEDQVVATTTNHLAKLGADYAAGTLDANNLHSVATGLRSLEATARPVTAADIAGIVAAYSGDPNSTAKRSLGQKLADVWKATGGIRQDLKLEAMAVAAQAFALRAGSPSGLEAGAH